MTKHVVFGDVHCHPFRAFSIGKDSRVDTTLSVIDEIREFCHFPRNITSAICLGDIFHSRTATKFEYFNKTFQTFSKFKEDGINLTILAGNHDLVDKSGSVTTIDTFSSFANIVKTPQHNGKLALLPYSPDFSDLGREIDVFPKDCILLAHIDVIGAKVVHGWESEKGIKGDLLSRFRLTLMGHFHLRQKVAENAYYIGTCCPQSFNEMGEPGYFCVLDDNTAEVQWFCTKAPKFVEWNPRHAEIVDSRNKPLKGNYIKVISEPDSGMDKAIEQRGALSWIYDPPSRKQEVLQREKGISLDSDLNQVVKTYAAVHGGDLNQENLVKVGQGLLEV